MGGAPAPAPSPTLAALSLNDTSFQRGTAKTVNITGATAGSSIAASSPPAGFTVNSAARTVAYDGTGSGAATPTLALTETLAGATNTPRASNVALTIAAESTSPTSRAWTYSDAGSNIASLHDFATLTGANGSVIDTVADASPYGQTLTGATGGGTKPKVATAGPASKPVAVTNYGDKSYFAYPSALSSDWGRQGMGFAIVKLAVDPPSPAEAGGPVFGHFGSANKVSLYPSEYSASEPFLSDFGSASDSLFRVDMNTLDLSAWHSLTQYTRHGDRRARINGADLVRNSFDGTNEYPTWGTAPKLGASPFSYSNHSYAIAITFRRVPSFALMQKVEGKAHHDRGLQALLPASHPYRASPPTVSSADPLGVLIGGQKIAIEGDSITFSTAQNLGREGWASRLAYYYPTLQFQNFAVNGAIMEGNSNSLEARTPDVIAYGGKAILILIGANDVFAAKYPTAADWLAALKRRIAAYRAGGYEKVAVGTILPQADASTTAKAKAANDLIRAAPEIDVVFDFAGHPAFAADNAGNNTTLLYDGLHPTATGYMLMVDVAEPGFIRLLGLLGKGQVAVAAGATLSFPVRLEGNLSTFSLSGADAAAFEIANGPEGAVAWDAKTLRYAGNAPAVAGTKNVTVTATDEFGRVASLALTVVAA